MQLGRKDLFWTYASASMRMIAGFCVLPFSLRLLSGDEMGIWAIFLSFTTIGSLLDFGFSSSFSRNITYIFSGAKDLKASGLETIESSEIDYGLLKSMLRAMRLFYGVLSLIFLAIFASFGILFMRDTLRNYSGNATAVWVAWILFGIVLAYELYTCYYIPILIGRGKIRDVQKISVFSQSIRIVITVVLLFWGFKILSMVIGVLIADLLIRIFSKRAFYDKKTKLNLAVSTPSIPVRKTIKILAPNSFKVGLMMVGIFLRQKMITIISPYFLPLPLIASFSISRQIIDMISTLGSSWYSTFYPQISQYFVQNRPDDVKRLYIKSIMAALLIFVVLGSAFVWAGSDILVLLKSKTALLDNTCLIAMLVFVFLEVNQSISSGILLAKNEVPFYKSNLVAGILTVVLLWLMFKFTSLGVWSLILSGGISMSFYLFWKWPLVVIKDLNLTVKDTQAVAKDLWNEGKMIARRILKF